jgi:hypothetical protein
MTTQCVKTSSRPWNASGSIDASTKHDTKLDSISSATSKDDTIHIVDTKKSDRNHLWPLKPQF